MSTTKANWCARGWREEALLLHKGGDAYIRLPMEDHGAAQISPTRDTRLRWMQSVIGCTHYIAGASEMKYLNTERDARSEFHRARCDIRIGPALTGA